MNISGFTTKTLLEFHQKIVECLDKDDQNISGDKDYGVREFKDWRIFSNSIELELNSRETKFTPVKW